MRRELGFRLNLRSVAAAALLGLTLLAPAPLAASGSGYMVLTSLESEVAPELEERLQLVVDFKGGELDLPDNKQDIEPVVTLSTGLLLRASVQSVEDSDDLRMTLEIDPRGAEQIDLSAFLSLHSRAVTDTWAYSWQR